MKKQPNQESEELKRLKKFLNDKPDSNKPPSNNAPNMDPKPLKAPRQPAFYSPAFSSLKNYLIGLKREYWRPYNQHLTLVTLFICFSTYVCYRMEDQYYKLRERVEKTQSFKQIQIDKEKKYIDRMLKGRGQFESVQIKEEEYEPNIKYKFEQFENDEDMDTKMELFEAMKEDFLKGQTIPDEYAEEFFKTFPELRSKI